MYKRTVFVLIGLLTIINLGAQLTSGEMKTFIENDSLSKYDLKYPNETKRFYELYSFEPVWTFANIQDLIVIINQANNIGLEKDDYANDLTRSFLIDNYENTIKPGSPETEAAFTDVALRFINDITIGNNKPSIGYNGLDYSPQCVNNVQVLRQAIYTNKLASLVQLVEPSYPEYLSTKNLISKFNRVMYEPDFEEVMIRSNKVNSTNQALLTKLYQLGLIDSPSQLLTDDQLKEKVKLAQQLFNLTADGVLRPATLESFNIPLSSRLKELKQAMNTIKWLSCIKDQENIVVVNIPSASLLLYQGNSAAFESRIIAGKRSTPTPTLCSRITEVILYPYWMVPYSIATKELLPSIKKNIGYLDAGNYQVINKQGKIMDPYKIDWNSLSSSNFPYIIRQSTGCDNALGLIKLNFYNPYSVYLHDTPNKTLFGRSKRFFSHGCMRVEKAMELGKLILQERSLAVDTLEEKGCLHNQSPLVIRATQQLPVFVLYNTAWFDMKGILSFHEDVYRKNRF